ncbi:hypothetical protein BD289DRAFT_455693 [Coniella lustricola]|uniref:tRNA-splicing endonuclease subunit Sen54 N-terminal domain-containing protein n=1 Tax=Coniella lustricola TaxID=2025994 RepID=A0A2T2ZYS8_9PEZI|nr:hypothetical protein BD289DRAFT_455693 [Coniella lustricola]
MAFDDDDDVMKQLPITQTPEQALETAEEALEDEAQDFAHFASLQRKNISAQAIRKGEKDFESHGTRSQASALETSRRAMEDVLSYTRLHNPGKDWVRGWYFPERWTEAGGEGEEAVRAGVRDEKALKIVREKAAERREIHAKDRVVCVGLEHRTLGRRIRGQGTQVPGWDQVWLLPEEALFLLERGTMDLWWPTASMAEVFSPKSDTSLDPRVSTDDKEGSEAVDEYRFGFPLSHQAAYALLVGEEGERGKVTLRNLQVFSNLNRAGFNVLRAPPPDCLASNAPVPDTEPTSIPLWQQLANLLFAEREPVHPAYGPLVQPGLYRSYVSIYKQLAVVPRHRPTGHAAAHPSLTADSAFRVQFHVWKPGTPNWSKTKPPTSPDYYLAVVDAQDTCVPTGEEIAALLDSVPPAPPPERTKTSSMHQRLKHGHRNVLLAVVDHGLVNFMRVAEGAFGEEMLYKNFDSNRGPRGGKRGGRGQGRGGRGGRGRGGRGGRGG